MTGWTINEVRAHCLRDVHSMLRVIRREQLEQERAARRQQARAESRRMSRG